MEIIKEIERNQYKEISLSELKQELKNIRYFEVLHNQQGYKSINKIYLTKENDLLIKIYDY